MQQHFYYNCDFKFLPNLEMISFILCGGHSETFSSKNDSQVASTDQTLGIQSWMYQKQFLISYEMWYMGAEIHLRSGEK